MQGRREGQQQVEGGVEREQEQPGELAEVEQGAGGGQAEEAGGYHEAVHIEEGAIKEYLQREAVGVEVAGEEAAEGGGEEGGSDRQAQEGPQEVRDHPGKAKEHHPAAARGNQPLQGTTQALQTHPLIFTPLSIYYHLSNANADLTTGTTLENKRTPLVGPVFSLDVLPAGKIANGENNGDGLKDMFSFGFF